VTNARIVLVDDHPVVRQGLRALLEAEPDFRVVAEAGDGLEALQVIERERPDVLIIDVLLPTLNGLEVARRVSQSSPGTKVIILSMHANEAYVLEAFKNGVSGYVLKESRGDDLVQAVREVYRGDRYLSPPLSERAIDIYRKAKSKTGSLEPYDTLTAREREVLHMVAEGFSNPQIAARLSISPRTVESHRANMMRKLNLRTQTDLIRFAIQRGIVPIDREDLAS
jgi:DNA-binding NarL/FixJ family response regulator